MIAEITAFLLPKPWALIMKNFYVLARRIFIDKDAPFRQDDDEDESEEGKKEREGRIENSSDPDEDDASENEECSECEPPAIKILGYVSGVCTKEEAVLEIAKRQGLISIADLYNSLNQDEEFCQTDIFAVEVDGEIEALKSEDTRE
ncbi:MAG: hypothetical protein ACOYMG_26590, partial [Candidatus Methylumidiphilus sp.]